MEKHIEHIVDLYFEDMPYSEEISQAQGKIKTALYNEYQELTKHMSGDCAFETILKKYAKLSDMATLVGYSEEQSKNWRSFQNAKKLKTVKKEILYQKLLIYTLSAFLMGTIFYLLNALFMGTVGIVSVVICFGFTVLFSKIYYTREKRFLSEKIYDTDAYNYLRTQGDRYAKRRINGIVLFFLSFSFFIMNFVHFSEAGQLNLKELLIVFFSNLILLELLAYIGLKNRLCSTMFQKRINLPDKDLYKKHLSSIFRLLILYWTIVIISAILLRRFIVIMSTIHFIASLIILVLLVVYNFTLRKQITFRNITFNKMRVGLVSFVVVIVSGYSYMSKDTWHTQPYINSIARLEHVENDISYNEKTGVYTIISADEDFKILQLTDIHLGGSLFSFNKDLKALEAIYAEIEYTKPDLVVVTGDMTMPMGIASLSFNNVAPVGQFAAFMRNVDIPWVFAYGNHDTESIATTSQSDLNDFYMSLSYKTSGNLLYPYTQPPITGRNNQLVEVRNPDGTLNQAIFVLDSNAYTGEGLNDYDYIHDDQVDWYQKEIERLNAQEGHSISSMAFFHIPLQEYRTAYELYEKGSDEVTHFFGVNEEEMFDKVCCSDYPSSLFDTMVSLGSTKAVFCGHDHYNNMSLEYQGIRLTYGMSIDYLAMPGIKNDTAQRGATLITLQSDHSFEIEQVPLTMITE